MCSVCCVGLCQAGLCGLGGAGPGVKGTKRTVTGPSRDWAGDFLSTLPPYLCHSQLPASAVTTQHNIIRTRGILVTIIIVAGYSSLFTDQVLFNPPISDIEICWISQ